MPYLDCADAYCDVLAMTGHGCEGDHWIAPSPIEDRRDAVLAWLAGRPQVWWHTTLIAHCVGLRNHLVRADLDWLLDRQLVERAEDDDGYNWRAVST